MQKPPAWLPHIQQAEITTAISFGSVRSGLAERHQAKLYALQSTEARDEGGGGYQRIFHVLLDGTGMTARQMERLVMRNSVRGFRSGHQAIRKQDWLVGTALADYVRRSTNRF
jgi:hypothetical protein